MICASDGNEGDISMTAHFAGKNGDPAVSTKVRLDIPIDRHLGRLLKLYFGTRQSENRSDRR